MSRPAERFGEAAPKLRSLEAGDLGEYLHEYTGELVETGESVRVLTLAPDIDDAAVGTFEHVADRWANASANANVVTVSDRGDDPRPWLAVPEAGETLASVATDLPPEAVETVVTETAEALRTLGLYNTVHGHLSPTDIRVTGASGDADDLTVQVGGFGLEGAVRAAVGESEPTPYTAPELLDTPTGANQRTDVYGLGAVTYFALTGQPPVDGADLEGAIRDGPAAPPSEYDDAVSPALDDAVLRALSADPEQRYETPYAFQRAFLGAFDPDAFAPATGEGGDGSGGADSDARETEPTAGSDGERDDVTDDSGTESGDDGAEPGDANGGEQGDADDTGGGVTRRALTGAFGLTAIGAVAGGALYLGGRDGTDEPATAPEPTETAPPEQPAGPPDFGGYLDGVENFDGSALDARGLETMTVEVGVETNGGHFGFGPPAVHVDNGATVRWQWTGEGGSHNVVSEGSEPLDSGEVVAEPGVNYEHTFTADGIYNYRCLPHEGLGMRGAVVVGDDYPTAEGEAETATDDGSDTASGDQVANRLEVVGAVGRVTDEDTIGSVEIVVKAAPGVDRIDLSVTTLQFVHASGTSELTFGATGGSGSATEFGVRPIEDAGEQSLQGDSPVLDDPADRAELVVDTGAVTDGTLGEGDTATVRIVTQSGGTTELRLVVPESLSGSDAVVL